MKRRRASKARALFLLICGAIFCFALVVFPLRGRGTASAGPTGSSTAKPSPEPGPSPHATAPGKSATPPTAGKPAKGAPPKGAATAAPAKDASDKAAEPTSDADAEPEAKGKDHAKDKDKDAKGKDDAPTIPMGKGLPVLVNVGVYFLDVRAFEDSKGEFEGTIDLRLKWYDSRLQFPVAEAYRGFKEWRGKQAEAQLESMWVPEIETTNRPDAPIGYVGRRLRIFPDGRVELITRTTARYKVKIVADDFPFDRQHLTVELLLREQTTDDVVLKFEKEDVEFSRFATSGTIEGWVPGLVDLKRQTIAGWNGDRYSGVTASLSVDRVPSTGIAPIFIPLVASLLIPLLAIWMNRATEDGFEIEAFELANMGIGGLFSVIALSFAIYTSYPILASGDNTVIRLFGLNYASLATSLGIVVLLFQYNLPRRWFGRHVHEEIFRYLTWALPAVSLTLSAAFLLAAAC
ncbi:MAG: hypothetical protein U0174_11840 [Polyangiaceae bacterium]